MYESMLSFPGGLFGDLERLRREFDDAFGQPASIRSVAYGAFPSINIGSTPSSVEVYAFAPGIDPAQVEVTLDRGVLTIAGERAATAADGEGQVNVYSRERTGGRFRRAVNLPDDVDPQQVNASYRDGVLRVSIARRQAAQPQRIAIQ